MRRFLALTALISILAVPVWPGVIPGGVQTDDDICANQVPRKGEVCADLCEKVNSTLCKYLQKDGPGFAVLVMEGDKPVLLRGYGHARLADPKQRVRKQEITKDTVFDLGSISKQFTALAILMLIDQTTKRGPNRGKYATRLSLDTKLDEFFPELPGANEITIFHLLNHSSGLPDYCILRKGDTENWESYYFEELMTRGHWYANMVGKPTSYMKNRDVIKLVAQKKDLDFQPGRKFEYSNTGYVVLAEIIRKATKKSLGRFLKDEIFAPLGMNNTFVYDETSRGVANHALCYWPEKDDEFRVKKDKHSKATYVSIEGDTEFNYVHGDGNVHSTIVDMMKWQRAWNKIDDIRRPSSTGSGSLITPNTFSKVFDPLEFSPQKPKYNRYSAGFYVTGVRADLHMAYAIHHGGDWLGFHSYVMRGHRYLFIGGGISSHISIVVLSNFDDANACEIAKELSKIYFRGFSNVLSGFKC